MLARSSPGVPTCRGINKTRTCGKCLVSNKDVRTVVVGEWIYEINRIVEEKPPAGDGLMEERDQWTYTAGPEG
jgi:hypothetical protein